MKNTKGETPRHIFSMEHEDLMKKGEAWMKETAKSCTLVATLIATVVFAAAFTVPGGNDSKGVPPLLHEPFFKVFAISEAIAMFSSSTSILMFLSILTSRYGERDFLYALPLMLMIGITTLFVSIAAMVVAFCSTILLSCRYWSTAAPILLGVFSCVPVIFIGLKFPLLVDIICSTYVSRFLFRSNNRLFQELPR